MKKGRGSSSEIEKPRELLSVPVLEAHIYYYYCSRKIINTIFCGLTASTMSTRYVYSCCVVRCIYISIRESRFYASFNFWGFNKCVRVFGTKASSCTRSAVLIWHIVEECSVHTARPHTKWQLFIREKILTRRCYSIRSIGHSSPSALEQKSCFSCRMFFLWCDCDASRITINEHLPEYEFSIINTYSSVL